MVFSCGRLWPGLIFVLLAPLVLSQTQPAANSSSSSSSKHLKKPAARSEPALDPGAISGGGYRNNNLGFSCPIHPSWILRKEGIKPHEKLTANEVDAKDPTTGAPSRLLLIELS